MADDSFRPILQAVSGVVLEITETESWIFAPDGAATELMMADNEFDPKVNEFLQQARDAVANSQWVRAKEWALKVKAFQPDNATANSILAAIEKVPPVVDRDPVKRLLAEAMEYMEKDDWDRARDRAVAARTLDPLDADAERMVQACDNAPTFTDPQTGQVFKLHFESGSSAFAANVAFAYLIAALVFAAWMAIDVIFKKNTLLNQGLGFGNPGDSTIFASTAYMLIALAAIAGMLGGIMDAVRSLVRWHSEQGAYGARFLWHDVAKPWMGAVVGVMGYVLIHSGVGLISGEFSFDDTSAVAKPVAVALGFLFGFSTVKVYKWFDVTVGNVLSTTATKKTEEAKTAAVAQPT